MTKIDIVSGFLGAGKTTLIKKLLKEALQGEQVVLIENEFGEIGIDGGFLKEAGVEITEMNSGCICCSLVGDFASALKQVLDQYHPDRILIEPSGVGKLSDVMRAVEGATGEAGVHLNSAVAVVDAKKCKTYLKNFGEFFENQIEHAGTIILSRTGEMSEEKINQCIGLIRQHNEKAAIITTPWDELDGKKIMEAIEGAKDLEAELLKAVMEEHEHEHHHHEHGGLKSRLYLIAVTVVLLIIAVCIERNFNLATWQLLLVYLIPYLLIGHETLGEAAEGIAKGDMFNEHFLMSIATLGALCIGFFPGSETEFTEAVFVMLFFQVGELFEGYAEGKSRDSISHLMDIRPDVANVIRNGEIFKVAPDTVAVGESILVRRGEKIPLDGIVTEGSALLDTVALTGESVPRNIKEGDEIYSGCINLKGEIRIRTTKTFGESTASKIIALVESADQNKSRSEAFITRFARIYTPVVVFAALGLAVLPPFLGAMGIAPDMLGAGSFGENFPLWLNRALIFLVVSCPCALVISVPLTFFGGIGGASRNGILIKGSNYMDALAKVDTVVFDKTGTLTHGEVLVQADEGAPVVVNDSIKTGSIEAVAQLKALGVKKTVMLTGDYQEIGKKVAEQIGIDEYHAELLPADKLIHVERLLKEKPAEKTLAYVGDGINDAPVLKRADVGIAMGALGSDAAIEAADVVLMDDDPRKIADIVRISRKTMGIVMQNIVFALGVKFVVLAMGAFGVANMWEAVFADVGVSVIAILNAMRALKA